MNKTIIASSVALSESPEGVRTLTIPSKTETIIVEMSPMVWARFSETAKWFGPPELLDVARAEVKQNNESDK